MSNPGSNGTALIFSKVGKLCRKHDDLTILHVLEQVDRNGVQSFQLCMMEEVIKAVLSHYKIKRNRLFSKNYDYQASQARKVCMNLLDKLAGMTDSEMAILFDVKPKDPYRARNEFLKLNLKVKADKELLAVFETLKTLLSPAKKKLESQFNTPTILNTKSNG